MCTITECKYVLYLICSLCSVWMCTYFHPLLPSLLALCISWTRTTTPQSLSPWLTSKRSPTPLKVPFSLVLMADRLWPHSLSAAACPHCVPLSARQRVGGGQTASPSWMPDMDVWAEGGGASAPRAELSSTCNSPPPYASPVRGWERHGPRVLVALGCPFNSWGS